jgi:exonuclease VII large subunit
VSERDEASVKKLLSLNPRKVGVYKPLFGAAFHDIIGTISQKTFDRVMMINGGGGGDGGGCY